MKNRQKLLTDEQWKLIEPLLPSRSGGGMGEDDRRRRIEPVWRAYFGFCKPGGVAIFARRVSFAFDLLAAIAAMARARRLAECVADAAWSAG